jgi:hypothetical protein
MICQRGKRETWDPLEATRRKNIWHMMPMMPTPFAELFRRTSSASLRFQAFFLTAGMSENDYGIILS